MNQREQKQFVRELADSIVNDIVNKIDAGKVPAEWDGHELRCLLMDKARASAYFGAMTKGSLRYREYQNTVVVNNL